MPKGGRREGAGRKAADEPRQRVTVSLPESLAAEIDRRAYRLDPDGKAANRSEIICQLLRKALALRK